jgi:hypothetical protein
VIQVKFSDGPLSWMYEGGLFSLFDIPKMTTMGGFALCCPVLF